MSALDITDDTVFVSKLRRTDTLPDGRVRQVFDIVNMPGLSVVCIIEADGDGDLKTVSERYCLSNGQTFDSIDKAVLAWDDLKADLELLDTLGQAILRYHHGLVRPLWEHRDAVQKEPWLTRARHFRQFAEGLGLSITKAVQQ
jgi:hypothetical protein